MANDGVQVLPTSRLTGRMPVFILATLLALGPGAGAFEPKVTPFLRIGADPLKLRARTLSRASITNLAKPTDGDQKGSTDSRSEVSLSSAALAAPPRAVQAEAQAVRMHADRFARFITQRAPGVALAAAIASSSLELSKHLLGGHLSPMLWATVLGMLVGNLWPTSLSAAKKQMFGDGIKFTKGRLLRLGIILYGFKITLQQIASIGSAGIMADIFIVSSTLTLGALVGQRMLKLDEPTSTLIASGAAICGCSAVLATQPIVGGKSHQVSAAVGTVVLCGTASMFLYPVLWHTVPALGASAQLMGVYTGSTIHEIAGVVAAGNAMSPEIAMTAVVTKLARVLLLAPALTVLSTIKAWRCRAAALRAGEESVGERQTCKIIIPWFALTFVAVAALNSAVSLPAALTSGASKASAYALACAMAALGMDSNINEIRQLGPKPLVLAGMLWAWLLGAGFLVSRALVGA